MRVPPPIIAVAAAGAQRALARDAGRPTPSRTVAAGLVTAGSAALMGTAMQQFRSHGTTVDPLRPERASALVSSGPFSLTRNPMYVGLAGLLAAHAVLLGSAKALVPLAGFVAVIDRVQIPPEETAMATLFGAEYEAYRSRVPRWVGRG